MHNMTPTSATMHHLEQTKKTFCTFFLLQPLVFPPPLLRGAGSVRRGGGRFCQWKPESGKHGLEIDKEKKKRTIFSKGPETQGPEFRSYKLDIWSFDEFEGED